MNSSSGEPPSALSRKLSIVAGEKVHLKGEPAYFPHVFLPLPERCQLEPYLTANVHFALLFVRGLADLEVQVGRVQRMIETPCRFWIAFQRPGLSLSLQPSEVRDRALRAGLIDVAYLELDDEWAAWRLAVYRSKYTQ